MVITKALYERAIIEFVPEEVTDKPKLEGFNDENKLHRVYVRNWGTMPDGSAFPMEEGEIAQIKTGALLTKLSDTTFMIDRRLILGIEGKQI